MNSLKSWPHASPEQSDWLRAGSSKRHGARLIIAAVFLLANGALAVGMGKSFGTPGLASEAGGGGQETRPRRVNPENQNAPRTAASPTPKASRGTVKPQKSRAHTTGGPSNRNGQRKPHSASATSNHNGQSPPPKAPTQGFTVQLGAFRDAAKANRLSEELKGKGYRAEVSTMADGHKRLWRLVRIGSYPDESRAEDAAKEISEKTGLKGIVRPTNRF